MKPLTSADAGVQELLDREAIRDCLFRYCRGIDRCDAEALRSAYWPGAIDDHVFWRGPIEDFIPFVMPILALRDQTMHSISNVLIRIEAAEARVESYFNAYERARRDDGTRNDITVGGRYLDRMERREGAWRIAHRQVVLDWYRVWPDSADWSRGLFGRVVTLGKRGRDDPSHALFGDTLI